MNRSWHWQMQKHRNFLRLANTIYSPDRSFQSPDSITTTMDPTTLVAFLFKAPPEARTVELLGSWDNFSRPYSLEHDRRRGTGFWSGCFKFHNIIFDGDSANWIKPRTGGLKQGGTYWYYYRLNDETEAYDDLQESTTACPLLPGQRLNVIEVPVEVVEPPLRCRSASVGVAGTIASLLSTHTLDPGDKFNPLAPPPVSRVHGRCVSDLALSGRLETKAQSLKSSLHSQPASSHSVPEQSCSQAERPMERYYGGAKCAYDAYEDERSSLYSRRSWRSAAPSFAHSSIVDAYGADSHAFDVDSFDLYPVHETSSGAPEPLVSVPYEEYINFDSSIQDEQANSADLHQNAHEDFNASWNDPAPLEGFNFFDSRPSTSYGRTDSQQQMFSTPQNDFHEYIEWPLDSVLPARHSTKHEAEIEAEPEGFDMLSPTFSAATLSSAGLNTPFRLSLGCSRTTSAYASNDDSIEGVAERLQFLGSDDLDIVTPIYEHEELALRNYTLPESEATRSTQSLGKLSSTTHDSVVVRDTSLPSLMPETKESSFAEDIFSELGFLGRSIV